MRRSANPIESPNPLRTENQKLATELQKWQKMKLSSNTEAAADRRGDFKSLRHQLASFRRCQVSKSADPIIIRPMHSPIQTPKAPQPSLKQRTYPSGSPIN